MSALLMLRPSLRAGRGAGNPGRCGCCHWASLTSLLVPSQPLSLPSSVAQPSGHFSYRNGKSLGVVGWQRGCAWMPIVRVSQSLGTCGLDRPGHSSGHVKVLVFSSSCPRQCTSHRPPSWVGLSGVYICGRQYIDGTNYGKGVRGSWRLCPGAVSVLRSTWCWEVSGL